MQQVPDFSAVIMQVADNPLVGPKPDQTLQFKRPQLAVCLEGMMQDASTPAEKQFNQQQMHGIIAAMSQLPSLQHHVVGLTPVHMGQKRAELHLSFKDASAQHRHALVTAGSLSVTLVGAAQPVSFPVRTVQCKQLPDITVVRMHNVPASINVRGLTSCLLRHCGYGDDHTVVAEYGGDLPGPISALASTWCRTDVCIAEVRAPVQAAKLRQLPSAFTCLGQQVSVSVQPSILSKAHQYRQQRAAAQDTSPTTQTPVLSSRQKRHRRQKAKGKQSARPPSGQPSQRAPLMSTFKSATSAPVVSVPPCMGPLQRPLDPFVDLGAQRGKAGLGHHPLAPMVTDAPASVAVAQPGTSSPMHVDAAGSSPPARPTASLPSTPTRSAQVSLPSPPQRVVQPPMPRDMAMPQASALPSPPVPADFPDSPTASAMLLWAEDIDVPVSVARSAVLHLHQEQPSQVQAHASSSSVALAPALQGLMLEAIRVVSRGTSDSGVVDEILAAPAQPSSSSELLPPDQCSSPPVTGTSSEADEPPAASYAEALQTPPVAPRRTSRVSKPAPQFWLSTPPDPGGAQ